MLNKSLVEQSEKRFQETILAPSNVRDLAAASPGAPSATLSKLETYADELGGDETVAESKPDLTRKYLQELVKAKKPRTKEEVSESRKNAIERKGLEPLNFALERVIGKNDSLYSNYFLLGVASMRAIGRIYVDKKSERKRYYATGFLISPNLCLTNYHVFQTEADARDSTLQMEYERDARGNTVNAVSFRFREKEFFYANKELDYAIVAVETLAADEQTPLSNYGWLYLDAERGKGEIGDCLTIIHHPAGDYKQISIRENELVKLLPNHLWYETDTAQGSSGAPVFNDQWQVIALHHSGVPEKRNGKYIGKDGQVVEPDANGDIDDDQVNWIANEGVRISSIIEHVKAARGDNQYIMALLEAKKPPLFKVDINNLGQKLGSKRSEEDKEAGFATPGSTKELVIPIHLSITVSADNQVTGVRTEIKPTRAATEKEEPALDFEKIEIDPDYDSREGYKNNFLGIPVPFPRPSSKLLKKASRLIDKPGEFLLPYHHFSIIHHSIRRLPIVTAVNIDGSLDADIPRKEFKNDRDVWYRDPRILDELQVGNEFYKGSGFQRGHMVRREDPGWGTSKALAKKANDDTFHFTNCCPQHGELNTQKWNDLEDWILNQKKGVMRDMKMSVFTGPILDDDNDPTFNGVQIPMSYYKVVAFVNDNGELEATAFVMDQIEATADFEWEFSFATRFRQEQIAIEELENLTGTSFGPLAEADTFHRFHHERVRAKFEELAEIKM